MSKTRSTEVSAHLRGDIGGQLGPAVEHRQDDALDREVGVEVVADEIERGEQLGQSFQGVVLALERDEHGVGGGQGVDGQQPERRRAVDEDVVVVGPRSSPSRRARPALAALDGRELDLGTGERDRRRDDVEARRSAPARSARRAGPRR